MQTRWNKSQIGYLNDLPSKTTDPLDPKRSLINQTEKPIPYQAAKEAELEEDAEGAWEFKTPKGARI